MTSSFRPNSGILSKIRAFMFACTSFGIYCPLIEVTFKLLKLNNLEQLQNQVYTITILYLVCPEVLSLVGELLSADGCGSSNHIFLFIFCVLIYLFIYSFILDVKSLFYPVKQLNHFLVKYQSQFTCTPSLILFSYYVRCSITGLLMSVICC